MIAALCGTAMAQGGRSYVESGLLVGAQDDDGVRAAGLRIKVADGWKTYWRSPGEAGIPPQFDWSGSENLASAEIAWPTPELFDSFGYLTIGYGGETILPLRLIPRDPALPIKVDVALDIGVCRDICVFEAAHLIQRIEPGDAGADAGLIAEAETRVTPVAADAGVTYVSCSIAGTGEDRNFSAVIDMAKAPGAAHVALEGPGDSWFHGSDIAVDGTRIEVTATLSLDDPAAWIDRSDIRMTVLGTDVAADIQGCRAS